MKKFKSNVEIKSRTITKPMIYVNIHRLSYIEKTEITYKQPYIEISIEASKSISNKEKQYMINLLLKKLSQKYNLRLENIHLTAN